MSTIHAAAAAALGAIPVPVLDRYAQSLVRGSAFRRVCLRHDVRLSSRARRTLAKAGPRVGWIARFVAPLRWADRVEDAVRLMTETALLDRYLRRGPKRGWRRRGASLEAGEAEQIVEAWQRARRSGTARALRAAPGGVWGTVRDASRSVIELDHEDRPPLERMVDTILDALSEVPDEVIDAMAEPFDACFDESERARVEGS